MEVPLLDLKRQNCSLENEFKTVFENVFKSGQYILGPAVESFEKDCAHYLDVKNVIGVSSGTDALLLALMALGIGPGDEVICPTFTFFATAGVIWRVGAKPVFVDMDPQTFNCDTVDIKNKITSKTKAIIPVHLFGQCADMDTIMKIAHSKGIWVIEDAAQAFGARYQGKCAGTLGTIGCFSFFPSKNLGGFGDAGCVVTNDNALAEKMKVLRVHGSKPKYYHAMVGGNFRIDTIQAALLQIKLKYLDSYALKRQDNAKQYNQFFDQNTSLPIEKPFVTREGHIYNQYVIRVKNGLRHNLQSYLKEKGIGTEVYYPVPMHLLECFKGLGYKRGALPVSELACDEVLAIPIFPELTQEEIAHVCKSIQEFPSKT